MNRKYLFLLYLVLFLTLSNVVFAQRHAGATPGTPATAPSATPVTQAGASASSSTQLIQGYHYRLKPKYHIKYKQTAHGPYTTVVPPGGKIPVNITDRFISFDHAARTSTDPATPPNGTLYVSGKSKVFNIKVGTHKSPDPPTAKAREDVRDSLSRYAVKALWVSVTQADSGKLTIQFRARTQPQQVDEEEEESLTQAKQQLDFKAYTDGGFDAAVPIRDIDSANNFYLQVHPKLLMRDPLYYISLPYQVWQYGATTIPFRYRFGNSKKMITLTDNTKTPPLATNYPVPSESTANISLAAYIGWKFGGTRFYYDATKSHNTASFMLSFFGGPTLVSLTANNISSGHNVNNYPSSVLAWSGGISQTAEFGPVNLGFFEGIDMPIQNVPWVYAYRPWIGFGIGFNLGMLTSAGSIGIGNQ